jgi:integrase
VAKLSVVMPPPTTGFQRLIGHYLQEKRAGGASPKTIRIYRDALEGVLVPFPAQHGVTELSQVTSRLLNDLNVGLLEGSASRTGRPLSKATVHSYVRAINTFLAWAKEQGETADAKAQLPSMRRRVLDTLSRDDITRMEDGAATERDKLIVRVLADTGVRLGELLGLAPADIRVEGGRNLLKIRGKGDRERLVPISPSLAKRLRKFADRTRGESTSDRIFLIGVVAQPPVERDDGLQLVERFRDPPWQTIGASVMFAESPRRGKIGLGGVSSMATHPAVLRRRRVRKPAGRARARAVLG